MQRADLEADGLETGYLQPNRASYGLFVELILDAGGEIAEFLRRSLWRAISMVEVGQVMEVISRDPTSRVDVPEWCWLTGHELLDMQEVGVETSFWIRKNVTGTGKSRNAG